MSYSTMTEELDSGFWENIVEDVNHEIRGPSSTLVGDQIDMIEGAQMVEEDSQEFKEIKYQEEILGMFLEAVKDFYSALDDRKIDSETVRKIRTFSQIDYQPKTQSKVDRIVNTVEGAAGYHKTIMDGVGDDCVSLQELISPLSQYMDEEIPDIEVKGNKGLYLPFLTAGKNYQEHVVNNDRPIMLILDDFEGKGMELNVSRDDGKVKLGYRQNGPGISVDDIEELTSKEYTTRNGGLGLNMANRVLNEYKEEGILDYEFIPEELTEMEENGYVPFGFNVEFEEC